MRIGLIGPADGDEAVLREAAEFLLGDAAVDQAIYLGADEALETMVNAWARELMEGDATEEAFLDRAARAALQGSAEAVERLLAADTAVRRLADLRGLPPSPARAIEMIDDRIVLLVNDKAVLDQEDIANAFLVVYGKAPEAGLRRFGPRYFFTPGPLRDRKVGVLEQEPEGELAIGVFDPSGAPLSRETLERRTAKLTVTP